jgi:uncharacterized protein YjiS (DUF1127 family)
MESKMEKLHTLSAGFGKEAAIWAWPFGLIQRLAARRCLAHLSDKGLRDVGLIRADIDQAKSLPLSADVATHLTIRANSRSSNW